MYASNEPARPQDVTGTTNINLEHGLSSTTNNENLGSVETHQPPSTRVYNSSSPNTPDRSPLIVRPRHPKPSRSLSKAQVDTIIEGGLHAHRIGHPLNRFITIDWDVAKVLDLWAAQSAFIKYIRDWLRRHGGGSATYVWVIENGSELGLHSHMMLHVPPLLIKEFSKHQRKWLRKIGIHPHIKGAVHTVPIGHSYWAGLDHGAGTEAYQHNLACLTEYLVKAANTEARRGRHIERPPQYSYVPGKRAGTSLNITPKAIIQWQQERRRKRRLRDG